MGRGKGEGRRGAIVEEKGGCVDTSIDYPAAIRCWIFCYFAGGVAEHPWLLNTKLTTKQIEK